MTLLSHTLITACLYSPCQVILNSINCTRNVLHLAFFLTCGDIETACIISHIFDLLACSISVALYREASAIVVFEKIKNQILQ